MSGKSVFVGIMW